VWVALAIVVLFFVKPGVKPLWRMVRACLEDKRCVEAVKAGQKILTEQQESMSEEDRKRISKRKKRGKKEKEKGKEKEKERKLWDKFSLFLTS
jgi:ribosomal protein L12E/L44/L45/RPP1/RPP2